MKIVKIIITFVLLVACIQIEIVEASNIKLEMFSGEKVSFEFICGFIFIKGKINESEKEYNFLFDTGSSVTIIDSACGQELNLKRNIIKKRIKGSSNKTKYLPQFEIENLSIGNLKFSNVKVVATDLTNLAKYTGREIHGVVGGNIIKEFVLTINYDKKYIVFSSEKFYKPTNREKKMVLKMEKNLLFFIEPIPEIKGSIYNKEINLNFRIDTGYSGGLSIPLREVMEIEDKFKNSLIKVYGIASEDIYGVTKNTYLVKVKDFGIGALKIDKIISDVHNLNYALLGNSFLKNFIVELNYLQNLVTLYWEGDRKYELSETFGLLMLKGNESVVISTIIEGSPADLAGLKVGDGVLEINSVNVNNFTTEEIFLIYRNMDVDKLQLKYKRGDRIEEVCLEKESIWDIN